MAATCTFPSDRDATLVAYLYDDIAPAEKAAFDTHVASCETCRGELRALGGVRQQLAAWPTPEARQSTVTSPQSTGGRRQIATVDSLSTVDRRLSTSPSWLPDIPAWAQVAAAVLILGVAAGIANFDVRYDKDGLSVRTGWSRAAASNAAAARVASDAKPADAVSRADLVALEQRLRDEVRTLEASAHTTAAAGDTQPARAADADVMRRVRVLLDENDKRQQRELALRVGELVRDVNAQRQSDLARIDRTLGVVQNNLGIEVLKQRERVNYLMRVNQPQPR